MNKIYKNVKMILKYGNPVLLGFSLCLLIGGVWFLYYGISGLFKIG